ncbi:MAG: hypothetical protein ACK5B9_12935 [Flavobacteriia bacterium]|jgi:hypothetical protein
MKTFEYYKNGTIHGTIKAENKIAAENNLFAQYGKEFQVEEKEIDLFNNFEVLPIEIQDILQWYSLLDNDYQKCKDLLNELKPFGYTFDYGLDAQPYNLQPMKETKIFELKNNSWIETEFNEESKQICLYDDALKFKGIGIFKLKETETK